TRPRGGRARSPAPREGLGAPLPRGHRPEAARTWPMVPPPREAVVAESFLERRLSRPEAELGEQPAELRRADPPPVAIAPPLAQDVAQHPQRGGVGAQGHGREMEHRALAGQAGPGPPPPRAP